MNKFVDNIITNLIENNTIKEEDKEIYAYGLKQAIITFFNIVLAIIIGFIFKLPLQSLLFLLLYVPIRSYAGGYHARTQKLCYFLSILMTVVVLYLYDAVPWTNLTVIITAAVSALVIFILAPIGDKNKPLDQLETKVYRKKTLIILSVELLILAGAMLLNISTIYIISVLVFVSLALMLLIALVIKKLS